MRLLRFNVVAEHLVAADALSRSPLADTSDEHTDQEVQSVVANAPVSSQKLDKIPTATLQDEELKKTVQFIRNGWPSKTPLLPSLHGYYSARAHLSDTDGQTALRSEVLQQLHKGHQGADITKTVSSCRFCIEHKPTQ